MEKVKKFQIFREYFERENEKEKKKKKSDFLLHVCFLPSFIFLI